MYFSDYFQNLSQLSCDIDITASLDNTIKSIEESHKPQFNQIFKMFFMNSINTPNKPFFKSLLFVGQKYEWIHLNASDSIKLVDHIRMRRGDLGRKLIPSETLVYINGELYNPNNCFLERSGYLQYCIDETKLHLSTFFEYEDYEFVNAFFSNKFMAKYFYFNENNWLQETDIIKLSNLKQIQNIEIF